MPWIKSSVTYDIFRADRQITEALHNEDGASGEVIAWVEATRAGDVEISEAAYQAIAETIKTHNGTLPVPASMEEIKAARETDREAKQARIQSSLGLNDAEWLDLKGALERE